SWSAASERETAPRLSHDRVVLGRAPAAPRAVGETRGAAAPPAGKVARVAARTADAPTFGQPTIAGIQGTGFEPDIRLDPSDPQRIYVSVPASLASDTSWIWHSRDAGKTFKWVPAATPKVGKSVACAGGGDTEVAVDGAGRVYFNDLTLANFSLARSDDHGNTWPCNNTGVPSTLVDRQWYAIDGDPTAAGPVGATANSLYLASNNVGQGAPMCPVSGAGNNVLVVYRSVPGAAAGLQFAPPNQVAGFGTCDEGIMGNIEVSPVATTTGEVGQPPLAQAVKHVYVIHDDATFSKIRIGRCIPVAFSPVAVPNTSDPSGLRCNDFLVSDLGAPEKVRTGANFPSLAIDNAGNLYAVWQQAAVNALGHIGDVSLRYSYSTDEGVTWSAPVTIPTPGLNNNVMTWAAAGDDGRLDIAWYGTPASVPAAPFADCELGPVPPPTPRGGPDAVNGVWSLYMTQTLNGHGPGPVAFTAPILAGEHHNHDGSIATVMGGLCGNRTAMGDFFKLRVGPQGEAHIIYSDANNPLNIGHTMYVKQNGGTGLHAGQTVAADPILLDAAADPPGDGVRELNSTTSANLPNLDILASTLTKPAQASCHPNTVPCYRVEMTLANLSLTPVPGTVDPVLVWHTQWLAPAAVTCPQGATACTGGGRNFHVYAESAGGVLRCFYGENSIQAVGGGVTMTYPPALLGGEITAAGACTATAGANGKIAIDVPIEPVSVADPLDHKLYSVTASTMTLAQTADSAPPLGVPFDVIDVVRAYDAVVDAPTNVGLKAFRARQLKGKDKRVVLVTWSTGSEVDVLGYNLLRRRGKAQTYVNKAPVLARGGALGASYTLRDKLPKGLNGKVAYRLQGLRPDGSRSVLRSITLTIR
ncbi:MAG: hypothetical protein ABR521_09850, partial [Gaiellaceae bacterium]